MENNIINSDDLIGRIHDGKMAIDRSELCLLKDIDHQDKFIYENLCKANHIKYSDDTKLIKVLLICTDFSDDIQNKGIKLKDIDGIWYFSSGIKMIPKKLINLNKDSNLKITIPMYLRQFDNYNIYKFFNFDIRLNLKIA